MCCPDGISYDPETSAFDFSEIINRAALLLCTKSGSYPEGPKKENVIEHHLLSLLLILKKSYTSLHKIMKAKMLIKLYIPT